MEILARRTCDHTACGCYGSMLQGGWKDERSWLARGWQMAFWSWNCTLSSNRWAIEADATHISNFNETETRGSPSRLPRRARIIHEKKSNFSGRPQLSNLALARLSRDWGFLLPQSHMQNVRRAVFSLQLQRTEMRKAAIYISSRLSSSILACIHDIAV